MSSSVKRLYNIYHTYEIFGSSYPELKIKHVATVKASEDEITAFLAVWNKPRVWYNSYDCLREHTVSAKPVVVQELEKIEPYNPETREWPDLPPDKYFDMVWDADTQSWKNP